MDKEKVKDEGEIENLDLEIEEYSNAIRKLDTERLERQKERDKLLDARCKIQSTRIFSDVKNLIGKYLKVQKDYLAMRDLVADVSKRDPDWYKKAIKENEDTFWITVIDSYLRIDRLSGTSLGTFMDSLCKVSEPLKDKSPYPQLNRDIQ